MSPLCRHRHGHILLALLVLLFAAASHGDPASDTYNCHPEPSTCGHLTVQYPFHLSNTGPEQSPTEYGEPSAPYCGYPGLAILCDEDKPILRLDRDDYAVSAIDYTSLTVSLADADVVGDTTSSCPTVHHNVTVPNPFHLAASTVTYLFFFTDCGFGPDAEFAPRPPLRKPPGIRPITCESTEAEPTTTMSFVLPERDVPPKDWWQACQSVYSAPVLRDAVPADVQGVGWRGGGYAKALRGGFQVGWDRSAGPCGRCEQSSGKCGYNSTGEFLGCSEISASAAALSGKPFRSNCCSTSRPSVIGN